MKKALFSVIGVLITVSLIACAAPAPTPTPAPAPAPAPTPTPAPAPEVYQITFQTTMGPGEKYRIDPLVNSINEASGGRIHIKLFLADEIIPYGEELFGVSEGLVDMAQGCGAYYQDLVPVAAFEFGFPFEYDIPGGVDQHILLYNFGLIDILREAYAPQGIYYVAPMVLDPLDTIGNKEVHSLEDLKKATVAAEGTTSVALKRAGIPTSVVEWDELYTALATELCDLTVSCSARCYKDYSFDEVCDYFVTPSLCSNTLNSFLFNLDKWNSLPPDVQALIELACTKYSYWVSQDMWKGEYEARQEMLDAGMEIISLDDEAVQAIKEASLETMEEWSTKDAYCAKYFSTLKHWWKLKGRLD